VDWCSVSDVTNGSGAREEWQVIDVCQTI